MKYCTSSHTDNRGRLVMCEGEQGHSSAHFAEGIWWENENGLPVPKRDGATRAFGCVLIMWLAAAATILGAAIYLAVTR